MQASADEEWLFWLRLSALFSFDILCMVRIERAFNTSMIYSLPCRQVQFSSGDRFVALQAIPDALHWLELFFLDAPEPAPAQSKRKTFVWLYCNCLLIKV